MKVGQAPFPVPATIGWEWHTAFIEFQSPHEALQCEAQVVRRMSEWLGCDIPTTAVVMLAGHWLNLCLLIVLWCCSAEVPFRYFSAICCAPVGVAEWVRASTSRSGRSGNPKVLGLNLDLAVFEPRSSQTNDFKTDTCHSLAWQGLVGSVSG